MCFSIENVLVLDSFRTSKKSKVRCRSKDELSLATFPVQNLSMQKLWIAAGGCSDVVEGLETNQENGEERECSLSSSETHRGESSCRRAER